MTQLQSLKSATSLHSIATLLQFKPKALAFVLYKETAATKYRTFDIPKRGGGVRRISAPQGGLRLLQRRLSDLLQDCVQEINKTNQWDDEFAHGFKRKRSIITNASKHKNKQYVFNLDLRDFFPSIPLGEMDAVVAFSWLQVRITFNLIRNLP